MINEEPFIQWLDKQIAIATTWSNAAKPHEVSVEADRFRIRAKVLQDVKKKFDELTGGDKLSKNFESIPTPKVWLGL